MSIERVKDILLDTDLYCVGYSTSELRNACDLAISALEKQVPKQVNEITIIQQYKAVLDGYCPSCQRYLTNSMQYCTDCGQLLDWEVDNESI